MAAWAELLRLHLAGERVPTGDRIALLQRRDEARVRYLGARLIGRARSERLLERCVDADALQASSAGDRRALLGRRFLRAPLASLAGMARALWTTRLQPLVRRRALTVAFLGAEGAGKSAVLEQVREQLEPSLRAGLRVVDYRFDDHRVAAPRSRPWILTLAVRLLSKLVRRPDALVVITARPEVVQARRPQVEPAESARQIAAYEALSLAGAPYHLVRNEGTIEEAASAVVDVLLGSSGSRRAPYALESWYPSLVAQPSAIRTLDEGHADPELVAAWGALLPGEALAVVDRGLHAGRVARLLARQPGLARLDRWYVLPGTGGSQTLLPCSAAGFAAGTSLLPGGRARWRVLRAVLRHGARLAPALGLDQLTVAVKGSAAPARLSVLATQGATVALTLGVPGPVRKAVARAVDGSGRVLGVAKLPLTEHARDRIRHEGQALAQLDGGPAPRLQDRRDGEWIWMEDLVGRRSGDRMTSEHLELLDRVTQGAHRVPLGQLELLRGARRQLAVSPPRDRELAAALDELDRALALAKDIPVVCAPAHGDFTPWNLMHTRAGLRALDWEFHLAEAPALFDAIHFRLQTGILVEHRTPTRLLEDLESDWSGPQASHMERLGVEIPEAYLHLAVYLLHQALQDDHLHRIERPPFVQIVWVRDARLELARGLARRLGAARRKVAA